MPEWWAFPNIIVAHLVYLVQMTDFEGQSSSFSYIVDSVDMGLELCSVLMVVLRVILELRLREKLTKIAMADVAVGLVCLGGIIYEARIAADFKEFLEAETQTADILRTFKCLRLVLLFLERKYYWKKVHDLIMILVDSVFKLLPIFSLWFIIILGFAIMGYHVEGGRILINEHGKIDMAEGQPNRFNFDDIYHALVFILLDSYDEEWDYLTFKEYLGVNPVIVGFQMIAMFICYLLMSQYLTGSLADELDLVLSRARNEDEDEERQS